MSSLVYSYYETNPKNPQSVVSSFGNQDIRKNLPFKGEIHNTRQSQDKNFFYAKSATESLERIHRAIEKYKIEEKKEVIEFLQRNPEIIRLVEQTYTKVHEFFEDVSHISLEVSIDPENNSKSLIATIATNLDFDSAFERLEEFDRKWFVNDGMQSEILFNILLALKA